jgi:spore coat polysaccharide biosynthesis predicted glycosyltransferase SpsG
LLGPRFVLLRREFRRWQERRGRFSPVARRILVTLGGADSRNATAKVLRALDWIRRQELEAVALVGPANPHRAELETLIRQSRAIIDLRQSVQDAAEWMAWADVAIAAGGTTTWELLFMGVPSLLLILADNQARVARSARAAGFARCLGRAEDVGEGELAQGIESLLADTPTRRRMANRGRECVDGDGVDRILMRLRGESLRLRRVRAEDVELLWQWANDPAVRRASFSQQSITWDEHVRWFEEAARAGLLHVRGSRRAGRARRPSPRGRSRRK